MKISEKRLAQIRAAQDRYRQRHPDRIRALREKRREAQKEYAKEYRQRPHVKEKSKTRKRANTDERRAKDAASARKRRAENPHIRINHRMSAMIGGALRRGKNKESWIFLVGYSLSDLVGHLERQFLPGMSWENIGKWEVDHIIPRSSFKFESYQDEEFIACWALTNLRPLWRADNRKKGNLRIHLL
jgi:hypothetical protein